MSTNETNYAKIFLLFRSSHLQILINICSGHYEISSDFGEKEKTLCSFSVAASKFSLMVCWFTPRHLSLTNNFQMNFSKCENSPRKGKYLHHLSKASQIFAFDILISFWTGILNASEPKYGLYSSHNFASTSCHLGLILRRHGA